jgi:hypothetical protein
MPIALGTIVSAGDKPLPKMRDWTKGSTLNGGEKLTLHLRHGWGLGNGSLDEL